MVSRLFGVFYLIGAGIPSDEKQCEVFGIIEPQTILKAFGDLGGVWYSILVGPRFNCLLKTLETVCGSQDVEFNIHQ